MGRMKEYTMLSSGSRHLSSNLVYYDALEQDVPELYSYMSAELKAYKAEISDTTKDPTKVYAMADAELEKEIKLLNEKFGGSFDASKLLEKHNRDDFKSLYADLNRAINFALGYGEVYERNITVIKTSKKRTSIVDGKKQLEGGKKIIITYFPTYLEKQLQIDLDKINSKIIEIVKNNLKNISKMQKDIKTMLETELREVCRKAAIMMFSSERGLELETELLKSGTLSEEEVLKQRQAYMELKNELEKGSRARYANDFIEELFRIYKIDNVIDNLTKQTNNYKGFSKKRISRGKNKGVIKYDFSDKKNVFYNAINVSIDSRGGDMLEVVENLATNTLFSKIKLAGGSVHTGQTGNMKADNIITIGFDTSIVSDSLAKSYEADGKEQLNEKSGEGDQGIRAKNIKAIEDLRNNLKGINNGFVVYSSAKNYTYNGNFSGFSAGSEQSIENFVAMFQDIHRTVRKNFRSVGGLILQLAEGAIGKNILDKKEIEDLIAHNIAYLLFDDFETIGYKNARATNHLHLMDLNGVFVPLSFILYLLAQAIEDANGRSRKINHIVNVHITPPKEVIFKRYGDESWNQAYARVLREGLTSSKTGKKVKDNKGGYSLSTIAWYYQREKAQQEAKIEAHFLKNFQEVIQNYYE